jgi:glyoxalase family protein
MDDHQAWRDRIAESGYPLTPVSDRFWFKSIYVREPSGVLFEIATLGPGFDVDEPIVTLGEHLTLAPNFEHLRDKLNEILTPLPTLRR